MMTRDSYAEAFLDIETALDAGDDEAFHTAMMWAVRHRTPTPSRAALRAAARVATRLFEMADTGAPPGLSDTTVRSLGWLAQGYITDIVTDREGRNRDFVESTLTRALALGRELPEGAPDRPIPRQHRPLELDEAEDLIAPYLERLERQVAAHPYSHLQLVWQVLEHPVPPFDTVFADWLADLDEEGIGPGDSLPALRRAMALARLADERQQRLSPEDLDTQLLPQLADPNPMVAACAARFLGVIYAEPGRLVTGGEPPPLAGILDRIAGLPGLRRPAAGGFLSGYGDFADLFHKLRSDPALDGFSVEDWVLRILADDTDEIHLPGTRAFWFPVHESYCSDPGFVARLLDAGHDRVALMTATERRERVEGMRPVLERLAASEDAAVAASARDFLARIWSEG